MRLGRLARNKRLRTRTSSYIKGFTFVELLLVTAMLSVIGLAIYSTFSSGINFWLRLSQEKNDEDVIIFFEKISSDLRNSFRYRDIDFKGSGDEVSFPVIAEFETKHGKRKGVGRVDYVFDRRGESIKVKQSNYSEVYLGRPHYERELVNNIRSLNFKYYYYNPEEEKYFWTGSWQSRDDASFGVVAEKKIPLAVRIEVEVKDENRSRIFQRTVFMPAAYHLSFVAD